MKIRGEYIILALIIAAIAFMFVESAIQIKAGVVCRNVGFLQGQANASGSIIYCSQPINAPEYTCILNDIRAGKCP